VGRLDHEHLHYFNIDPCEDVLFWQATYDVIGIAPLGCGLILLPIEPAQHQYSFDDQSAVINKRFLTKIQRKIYTGSTSCCRGPARTARLK
jgi:hypothetical protein